MLKKINHLVLILTAFIIFSFLIGCRENNVNNVKKTEATSTKYNGPIIDMHLHTAGALSTEEDFFYNEMTGKSYKTAKTYDEQKKETYALMEKYNVVKAMVSGFGAASTEWYNTDPDRIIKGVLISENHMTIEEIRKMYDNGQVQVLGEMAQYYEGIKANDDKVKPYFDFAEEKGLPVGYHIFPGGTSGIHYHGMPGVYASNSNPMQIEKVLSTHPKLKLYIMHAGWPYLEDMKALMFTHPQLYVDISAINWLIPTKESHSFLKGLVDAGYGKRIMYGTDQQEWPSIMHDAIEAVNSASFLTQDQKADIFYYNAARFLGLSENEIKKHCKRNE